MCLSPKGTRDFSDIISYLLIAGEQERWRNGKTHLGRHCCGGKRNPSAKRYPWWAWGVRHVLQHLWKQLRPKETKPDPTPINAEMKNVRPRAGKTLGMKRKIFSGYVSHWKYSQSGQEEAGHLPMSLWVIYQPPNSGHGPNETFRVTVHVFSCWWIYSGRKTENTRYQRLAEQCWGRPPWHLWLTDFLSEFLWLREDKRSVFGEATCEMFLLPFPTTFHLLSYPRDG